MQYDVLIIPCGLWKLPKMYGGLISSKSMPSEKLLITGMPFFPNNVV